MSIRLRLTILYTSILGVTLVVFALFVYALLTRNLLVEIDHSLADIVGSAARLPRLLGVAGGESDRPELGRFLAGRTGGSSAPFFPVPDTYVQIVDSRGSIVARSASLTSADVTLPFPSTQPSRRSFQTVRIGGQDLRLVIDPVSTARGGGMIEVAR